MERSEAATMKGNPITLIGPEIRVGQQAPDFLVQTTDLKDARLGDFKGKIKLIASVPSLDTPVCDAETHRFNQEATQVSGDVVILFIIDRDNTVRYVEYVKENATPPDYNQAIKILKSLSTPA